MIEALVLLNSQGLKIASEVFSNKTFFLGENQALDLVLNTVYSHLNLDFPEKLPVTVIDFELIEGIFGAYFVEKKEIYFIFSNTVIKRPKMLLKDKKIVKFIDNRQKELRFFNGIFISDWQDSAGPVPLYNKSTLDDETLTLLAVQGTTILGMGMNEVPNQLVGPIPVPKTVLSFIVYMYKRTASESSDSRIVSKGRPTTIFIILELVEGNDRLDKETQEFIKTFLEQYVRSEQAQEEFLYEEDLDQLNIDLKQTVLLAKDLITMRTLKEGELSKLLHSYASENMLMKSEIVELKAQIADYKRKEMKKTRKNSRKRILPALRLRRKKIYPKES